MFDKLEQMRRDTLATGRVSAFKVGRAECANTRQRLCGLCC